MTAAQGDMTRRSFRLHARDLLPPHRGRNQPKSYCAEVELEAYDSNELAWGGGVKQVRQGRAGPNLLWINTALLTDTVSGSSRGNWTLEDPLWLAAANVKHLPNSRLCKSFSVAAVKTRYLLLHLSDVKTPNCQNFQNVLSLWRVLCLKEQLNVVPDKASSECIFGKLSISHCFFFF